MRNNKGLVELCGCYKVLGSFSQTTVEPLRFKGVLECLIYRDMHDVSIKLDAKIVVDGMFKLFTNISKLMLCLRIAKIYYKRN
ncbi:hypothetical protein NC652_015773 [Populus alba x Populus x berolinensis]|nr:hypothetical protein NC652_015773 [Populus alba x Populus x berolinensis]